MRQVFMGLALLLSGVLVACGPRATQTTVPLPSLTEVTAAPTRPLTAVASIGAPTLMATPVGEETALPGQAEAYPTPETYPEKPVAEEGSPYPGEGQASPSEGKAPWVIDGAIHPEEYSGQIVLGPVAVFWGHDGTHLYLAAETQTEGWLGIGLDPEDRMQGADFVIAAFDGTPQIWDAYGQEPTGAAHPPDTDLGGTMDILEYAVVKEGPFLRFEVVRPLNSGDAFDKPLEPGKTYKIIAAVGVSSAFDARHAYRGGGEITLE